MLSAPRGSSHCRQMHEINTISLSKSKPAHKPLKTSVDVFYFSTAPKSRLGSQAYILTPVPHLTAGSLLCREDPACSAASLWAPGSAICTWCGVSPGRSGVSWPVHPISFPRGFIFDKQALNPGATCSLSSKRTNSSQVNEDTTQSSECHTIPQGMCSLLSY